MRVLFLFTILMMVLSVNSSARANQKVIDIVPPEGFIRTEAVKSSYSSYLRNLPLKAEKTIKLWNGQPLPESSYQTLAVLAVPLMFEEDLEQCADFGMRLWAEYLKSIDALDKLALFDFHGNKRPFSESGKSFSNYLHWHMKHSNSYSIKLGAEKNESLSDLSAGDMFVQNDSKEGIGHVSVVVDEAVNVSGNKVYLVGYSFMPAQEFHIEKASDQYGIDGWFTAQGYKRYAQAAFGAFGEPVVMRFD